MTETPPPASPDTPSLRVLMVDDDALILMNGVDMLEDMGHEVSDAYSGQQALDLLFGAEFDVLLTDMSMPGMNGADLVRAARRHRPELAVVIATGYGDAGGHQLENVQVLAKPYDQVKLERALRAAIAGTL